MQPICPELHTFNIEKGGLLRCKAIASVARRSDPFAFGVKPWAKKVGPGSSFQ